MEKYAVRNVYRLNSADKSIWFIHDNAVQQLHRFGSRLQPVPGWATHTMSESIHITAVLLSAVHTRSSLTVFSARPHDCWFELFSSCRCSLRWGRRLQTQARDRELVGTWHTTDISALRQRNIVHAIATQNHQEAAGCFHMNHTVEDNTPEFLPGGLLVILT